MAIYQGSSRNIILDSGYGTVIDPSLNLYLDPANPASYVQGSNSTILKDISGKGNDGTMLNGTSITYATGSGSITSPATNVVTTLGIDTDPVTISAWAYGTSITTRGSIISTDNGVGSDKGIDVSASRWLLHTGTSTVATGYLLPGAWYNVVATYGTVAPTLKLYVNSMLMYTGSAGASVGGGVTIGSTSVGTANFTGSITVASVYKKELTQAEITQNYNAQAARFGLAIPLPSLKISLDAGNLASYSGSGTAWNDLSGNGYNGTLSSAGGAPLPAYINDGGGSFYFDGAASTTTARASLVAFSGVPLGTVYTVDTWIKPVSGNNSIWFVQNNLNYMLSLSITSGNRRISCTFGSATPTFNNIAPYTLNSWYNFVFVRNADILRLYINGFLAIPQDSGNSPVNTFTLQKIGALSGNTFGVQGYMSTFKVYDGLLNDLQVYNNFQSTRARYGV